MKPSFVPSTLDGTFNTRRESGIRNIGDLYINGSFASFHHLQQKFGLPKNDFFRFLQVRSYVKTHLKQFENAEPDRLDSCLEGVLGSDHVISRLHDALQHISCPTTNAIKSEWEKELGTQIQDGIWEESLAYIHSCFINAHHCLIQFKIIHRLHYSKEKLHRIFPEVSPLCDKCSLEEGNLLHSYALCTKLQGFWTYIFTWMSKILAVKINPIIFGSSKDINKLRPPQRQFVAYGLLIAKKLVLLFWKDKETPTLKMWITNLMDTLHLERIRFAINNKLEDFNKIWHPLVSHLAGDTGP